MYLTSLPSFLPNFSSQLTLLTTILLIILLVVIEFVGNEDEESTLPFLLYPAITVLGMLVLVTVVQYVR